MILRKLYYSIKRAFIGIYESLLLNIVAILTIAVSFLLLSGFILIIINFDSILKNVKFDVEIIGFVKERADENKLGTLVLSIQNKEFISSLKYIKKDEAKDRFVEDNAELKDVLAGLDQNPFPATIEITLKKNINSITILKLIDEMRSSDLFSEVNSEQEWLERYISLLKTTKYSSLAIILFLILAISFIIANTVKLIFFSRRDEIEIMLLVGATKNFVKFPFLLEGLIQGLIGSSMAVITLWIIYISIENGINRMWLLSMLNAKIFFFSSFNSFLIILFGSFLGFFSTFFSLGRYLTYWKE